MYDLILYTALGVIGFIGVVEFVTTVGETRQVRSAQRMRHLTPRAQRIRALRDRK
jgi:hypothetical protein